MTHRRDSLKLVHTSSQLYTAIFNYPIYNVSIIHSSQSACLLHVALCQCECIYPFSIRSLGRVRTDGCSGWRRGPTRQELVAASSTSSRKPLPIALATNHCQRSRRHSERKLKSSAGWQIRGIKTTKQNGRTVVPIPRGKQDSEACNCVHPYIYRRGVAQEFQMRQVSIDSRIIARMRAGVAFTHGRTHQTHMQVGSASQ